MRALAWDANAVASDEILTRFEQFLPRKEPCCEGLQESLSSPPQSSLVGTAPAPPVMLSAQPRKDIQPAAPVYIAQPLVAGQVPITLQLVGHRFPRRSWRLRHLRSDPSKQLGSGILGRTLHRDRLRFRPNTKGIRPPRLSRQLRDPKQFPPRRPRAAMTGRSCSEDRLRVKAAYTGHRLCRYERQPRRFGPGPPKILRSVNTGCHLR